MASLHVKRGDEVVIIAGSQKGKRGKILEVLTQAERVVVEGANMRKRHMGKSQQHPQGAIVEREAPVHVSNVMASARYDARRTKNKKA